MRIYNTLTRKKEEFKSIEDKKVNMYVCGPTTYNFIHIGNARPMIFFDAFRKYLIHLGYEVLFIQNYTDVDDKIINKAKEEGIDPLELAKKYIVEYERDAKSLGVLEASVHPKVSENIDAIINLVETLISKGLAYEVNGDVYFDVRNYKPYGKLSGRNIDDLRSGARVEVGSIKRDPLDFALWKSAKKGEISWDSPFGKGRPGWHIECSAMSIKHTGRATLDIHGGGQDLIFPHHENEVAQSEGFTGEKFVNYWMHNGFITVNKEKMSKSLGNFFLVRDVLKKFSGQVIRYFLLATQYRSPIDFNDVALKENEKALSRLNQVYLDLKEAKADKRDSDEDQCLKNLEDLEGKIENALADDFNTAMALGYFFEVAKEISRALKENKASSASIEKAYDIFKVYLEDIYGVLPYVKVNNEVGGDEVLSSELMKILIELRNKARKEKDFALSDEIRDSLEELKIELLDSKEGTTWKMKD